MYSCTCHYDVIEKAAIFNFRVSFRIEDRRNESSPKCHNSHILGVSKVSQRAIILSNRDSPVNRHQTKDLRPAVQHLLDARKQRQSRYFQFLHTPKNVQTPNAAASRMREPKQICQDRGMPRISALSLDPRPEHTSIDLSS